MCPDLACLCLPWRVGCRTLLAVTLTNPASHSRLRHFRRVRTSCCNSVSMNVPLVLADRSQSHGRRWPAGLPELLLLLVHVIGSAQLRLVHASSSPPDHLQQPWQLVLLSKRKACSLPASQPTTSMFIYKLQTAVAQAAGWTDSYEHPTRSVWS